MSSPCPDTAMALGLRSVLDRRLGCPQPEGRRPPPGAVLGVSTPAVRAVVAAGNRQELDDAGRLEQPLPMTAGTVHDLGSVTKLVGTTSAVLAMVDGGELELDAPLSSVLPAARGSWLAGVTCRDLLLHRAGLWEWWPTYLSARSPDAAIELVLRLPPRYPRDAGRHYSDLGFMLLGAVVAGNNSLADVVHTRVLRPLGLAQTSYAAPRGHDVAAGARGDEVERGMLATGDPYPVPVTASDFDGWRTSVRVGEVDDGNAFHAFGGVAGHAGLFSTADDLLTWGDALLASLEGSGPWRPAVVSEFLAEGPDDGQRLGLRSWQSRCGDCVTEAFGHPGFPGVVAAVLPGHAVGVVLMMNRLHLPEPHEAVVTEQVWRPVLDDVHALLHEPGEV